MELHEANNFCDITDNLRLGPVFEELMLRHGGAVAIRTNIDPNEFEALGKDMTFTKAE
jgi:hypothetical protein